MPADPLQIKSIFLAVVEKSPDQRAAFLDQACGPNSELRQRRVEQLLSAHDLPAASPTSDDPRPNEPVGSVVAGRYKLLQLLGEGGMGRVFMAEQTQPFKRKVAVKLVKAGMDSGSVLARFEAERQALALMDHPNIAKVLDAGTTESGQPFFVMELVKGVPLTQFCDERNLDIAERLHIFQQICQAVQHAHQKGIIHRDLKPTNILVESHDGRPVPKVIDFGLAKAMNAMALTERSLFTHFGAMLGTPLYMAPEQAELSAIDVDTRADIYALGVILYELLTGTTPLEKKRLAKAAWDEIRRVIKEEEPPKPSTRLSTSEGRVSIAAQRHSEPHKLGQVIRGDLDWIVMKSLAKERDRRYATANAFAADVERFLKHEPVSAGPPTLGYKLRKFMQRNRAGVAVAATLTGLLLLGGVGLVLGIVAIRAEQQRTAIALTNVTTEQAKTQAALEAETTARKQTREALNAMTDDVIEKLFARQPQLGDNERAFLQKVLGFYQAFAAEKGESEEARTVAADGQYRVAKVRAFLGEREKAVTGYREAIRLGEKLVIDFPNLPNYRLDLARSHNNLGVLLRELGKRPEANAAFSQALALQEKLATDFPKVSRYRHDLAGSHHNLGLLLQDLGQRPEAEAAYNRALAIQEKLAADFPKVPNYRQELGSTHNNLGNLWRELRKLLKAEAAYRQALAIREKLAGDFPTIPEYRQELASSFNNLGVLLYVLGNRPKSEAAYRQALTLQEKLAADFPNVPDYRQDLARSYNNLGNLMQDQGKRPETEYSYRQALTLQEKLAADFPNVSAYRTELAGSYVNFGILLLRQKRTQDALEWYARAIPLLEANLASDARTVTDRLYLCTANRSRASALKNLQRYAEAVKDWDRAIELAEGPDRPALRVERAVTLALAGVQTRAIAEADELTRDDKSAGHILYNAACIYGLALRMVKDGASLKESYAGKALALLRRASAAGFFNFPGQVEYLKKDDDLAPLRDRADFKQFVTELEKKLVPPKK